MVDPTILPTGVVTFLFTDLEGSTKLWERHGEYMRGALARHDALLLAAVQETGGHVIKTTGDGLLAVFDSAVAACAAALAGQRALTAAGTPEIAPDTLRVRMGMHTGEAELRDGDYHGTAVNRAARVMALGHGGQVLLSAATAGLLQDGLPPQAHLRDLGDFPLRGLSRPEQIFQLCVADLPADFPPLKSGKRVAGNLPVLATSFVGRTREMAEVSDALPQTRLLTLTGPGGTGKTRLSLQVAAALQENYRHGAWLAELAPITDPALVPTAVAGIFNLDGQGLDETHDLLLDYLSEKELLLVLDNCEHLIEASALLAAEIIAACPHVTILASSREGLNVPGETTYHLPTLGLPPTAEARLEQVRDSEAAQLFAARAAAAQPGFTLNENNAAAVAQVVRRLDGIPLAIELAAARLRVFSVAQIAARLDDCFRLLTGGSRTALPRQQTLRALIDWSYDLLDDEERALFRRLSVFQGGWTLEAAESIAGELDIYTLLPELVSKSLVSRVAGAPAEPDRPEASAPEPRFAYLETIRQYARDRLVESREVEDARDSHFAYYETLGQAVSFGDGPRMTELSDGRFLAEQENLRAAVEWGTKRYPHRVLEMVWNYFPILSDQFPVAQGISWLETALQELGPPQLPNPAAAHETERLRLRGLVIIAVLTLFLGQLQDANRKADKLLPLLEDLDSDPLLPALVNYVKAQTAFFLDDPALEVYAVRAADLFGQASDFTYSTPLRGLTLTLAATGHANHGQEELAAREMQEAKELTNAASTSGLPWLRYSSMIIFLSLLMDPENAQQNYVETAAALRQTGSTRMAAMTESDLAHRLRREGDLEGAMAIYPRVLADWRALGHRAAMANVLENIAFVQRAQGKLRRSAKLFGAAERVRAEAGQEMLPSERVEYDREVAALRSALPPPELEQLWANGRTLGTDTVIDLVQNG